MLVITLPIEILCSRNIENNQDYFYYSLSLPDGSSLTGRYCGSIDILRDELWSLDGLSRADINYLIQHIRRV
jgi:hypothetical protein